MGPSLNHGLRLLYMHRQPVQSTLPKVYIFNIIDEAQALKPKSNSNDQV